MHALINTTLEIARNGSACACSLATTVTGYAQNDRSAMAIMERYMPALVNCWSSAQEASMT